MTDNQDLTSGTIPSDADITSVDGSEAVEGAQESGFTLAELNTQLGKEFKNKDAALKALKDTFSFVGKAGQQKAPEATPQPKADAATPKYATKDEVENMFFYRDNPQFAEHREILESLAATKKIPLSEVIKDSSFSSIFEKAQEGDKARNSKSVVQSGSRLGVSSDVVKEAREIAKSNPSKAVEGLTAALTKSIRESRQR
jgi:hypothetical protein